MASDPIRTEEKLDEWISRPDDSVLEVLKDFRGGVAVLGAAGKMGYHLCRLLMRGLRQAGSRELVHAVSRFQSVRGAEAFRQLGCQVWSADLSDPMQLNELPEVENVFFLAGVKFGTDGQPDLLQRMNVDMPRAVAERYSNARVTALSTGCVYAFTTPSTGGSREEDPTDPPGAYARSCLGREDAFRTISARQGTRCSLIRLNYSIDLRYGVLVDLGQAILAGRAVDLSMGYVNLIWQGDALRWIVRAHSLASSPPAILNITGSEILRVRDLALQLCERLGRPVQFSGKEAETAWLSNPSKAHQLFGKPSVSLEAMLDHTADWLLAGGPLLNRPTHFQTRDGRY